MNCDDVREHLAEYLMGSLSAEEDGRVRSHLRGCMSCRRELAALDEGMRTFARAAHQVDPPETLRSRVLSVIGEEGEASKPVRRKRFPVRRIAVAAAAVILLGTSTGIAAIQSQRAGRLGAEAASYRNFLGALGGKDVRVGALQATGQQDVQGSIVMYDSDHGQSWILVLVRAINFGKARVVVLSDQHRIALRPMEFDAAGEASTWLVTANDISRYDRVRIIDMTGRIIATGVAKHE